MLWVKVNKSGMTYVIEGYNMHRRVIEGKEEYELWITRYTGKSLMIAVGTKEQIEEYIAMFETAIKENIPLVEV